MPPGPATGCCRPRSIVAPRAANRRGSEPGLRPLARRETGTVEDHGVEFGHGGSSVIELGEGLFGDGEAGRGAGAARDHD